MIAGILNPGALSIRSGSQFVRFWRPWLAPAILRSCVDWLEAWCSHRCGFYGGLARLLETTEVEPDDFAGKIDVFKASQRTG